MDKLGLAAIAAEQKEEAISEALRDAKRQITIDQHMAADEITAITGVRRCGKSTLLRAILKQHSPSPVIYLNFEDPRLADFQPADFQRLYELWLDQNHEPSNSPRLALFDEIQDAPQWERWVNFFSQQKKFKVVITGSNSTLLSSELATRITGRHLDIELFPFSFAEVLSIAEPELIAKASHLVAQLSTEEWAKVRRVFERYYQLGGFPRVWLSGSTALLPEYLEDILFKDIVRRKHIRNSQPLLELSLFLMTDIGRLLNKTRIAKELGLKDQSTIKKYMGYFEESYLGFEVRKFDRSVRRQLRNLPKFYAIDHHLARRVTLGGESRDGFYLENLVYLELRRRGYFVNYVSNADGSEVDFIARKPMTPSLLVQVAWSLSNAATLQRELKAFEAFHTEHGKREPRTGYRRLIVTADEQSVSAPEGVEVFPFYKWALGWRGELCEPPG